MTPLLGAILLVCICLFVELVVIAIEDCKKHKED